jgi:hypothetical protein
VFAFVVKDDMCEKSYSRAIETVLEPFFEGKSTA